MARLHFGVTFLLGALSSMPHLSMPLPIISMALPNDPSHLTHDTLSFADRMPHRPTLSESRKVTKSIFITPNFRTCPTGTRMNFLTGKCQREFIHMDEKTLLTMKALHAFHSGGNQDEGTTDENFEYDYADVSDENNGAESGPYHVSLKLNFDQEPPANETTALTKQHVIEGNSTSSVDNIRNNTPNHTVSNGGCDVEIQSITPYPFAPEVTEIANFRNMDQTQHILNDRVTNAEQMKIILAFNLLPTTSTSNTMKNDANGVAVTPTVQTRTTTTTKTPSTKPELIIGEESTTHADIFADRQHITTSADELIAFNHHIESGMKYETIENETTEFPPSTTTVITTTTRTPSTSTTTSISTKSSTEIPTTAEVSTTEAASTDVASFSNQPVTHRSFLDHLRHLYRIGDDVSGQPTTTTQTPMLSITQRSFFGQLYNRVTDIQRMHDSRNSVRFPTTPIPTAVRPVQADQSSYGFFSWLPTNWRFTSYRGSNAVGSTGERTAMHFWNRMPLIPDVGAGVQASTDGATRANTKGPSVGAIRKDSTSPVVQVESGNDRVYRVLTPRNSRYGNW